MDFMEASPSKRPRTSSNANSQVTECVRQFKLPQQFPSMITIRRPVIKESTSTTTKRDALSLVPILPFCNGMKFVPNGGTNISSKIQKLKLKSPDGRDLGEFNVKLLPLKQDGKAMTFTKGKVLQKLEQANLSSILKRQEVEKVELKALQTSVQSSVMACKKNNFNLSPCPVKSNKTHLEHRINVSSTEHLSELPNKTIACKESKETRVVNKGNKFTANSQKNKTLSVPVLRGNRKVLVIRTGKQSRINFHNIQRDIRNLLGVAPHKKLVILHADKHPRLTGNNKITSLNSTPSKIIGNTIVKRFKPTRLNLDSKSSVNIGVKMDEKCSKESEKINSSVNSNINGAKSKQRCKLGTNARTHLIVSEKCNGKSKCSLQTSVTSCSSKSTVSDKNMVSNVQCNKQTNIRTYSKKILPSIHDRAEHAEQVRKDLSPKNSDKTQCNKRFKNNSNSGQNYRNFKENIMVVVPNDKAIPLKKKGHCMKRDNNVNLKAKHNDSTVKNIHCDANATNATHVRGRKSPVFKEEIMVESSIVDITEDVWEKTSKEVDSIMESNDKKTDREPTVSEGNIEQEHLTNDLSILQKALSSVKDKELREKAIKALTDCGIGIERQVPAHPPPDLMSIHDSQTQTNVFGLLDTENFVAVTEDSEDLVRIKQKTHQRSLIDRDHSLCHSLMSQNSTLSSIDSPFSFNFNLDSTLDSFLITNLGTTASRIKQIFSEGDLIVEKAYKQLKKDFVTLKQTDKNGMLNIHRAVVNNNVREVQRQLMLLKACNENVDLLTRDGKTSLELAIQYDVNPQIIRLLLKAGAQPVSSEVAHDSALIIASRMSSSLLPEIIGKVSTEKLLDSMDLEGFAALHYCAQLGHFIGVDELIRGGADVNLRDSKSGRTPLFHALENQHLEVAQQLLDHGAISNIINFAGHTVLTLLNESLRNHSLIESIHKAIK